MSNLGAQFIPIQGTAQRAQPSTPPGAVFLQGITGAMQGRQAFEARQVAAQQQQFKNRMDQGQLGVAQDTLGVQQGTLAEKISQNDEASNLAQQKNSANFLMQMGQSGYAKPASGPGGEPGQGEKLLGKLNGVNFVYRDKPKTSSALLNDEKLVNQEMFNATFRTPLIRDLRKEWSKARLSDNQFSALNGMKGYEGTPDWDIYVERQLQQYGTSLKEQNAMADAADAAKVQYVSDSVAGTDDNIFAGIPGLDASIS